MVRKGGRALTITVPLQPQEEARLIAVAQAKGLSTGALVREALDRILAEAKGTPDSSGPATGTDLVAAMQGSPYREISLEVPRNRLPVRDVVF